MSLISVNIHVAEEILLDALSLLIDICVYKLCALTREQLYSMFLTLLRLYALYHYN